MIIIQIKKLADIGTHLKQVEKRGLIAKLYNNNVIMDLNLKIKQKVDIIFYLVNNNNNNNKCVETIEIKMTKVE